MKPVPQPLRRRELFGLLHGVLRLTRVLILRHLEQDAIHDRVELARLHVRALGVDVAPTVRPNPSADEAAEVVSQQGPNGCFVLRVVHYVVDIEVHDDGGGALVRTDLDADLVVEDERGRHLVRGETNLVEEDLGHPLGIVLVASLSRRGHNSNFGASDHLFPYAAN